MKRQQLFLRNPEDQFLYPWPVFGDKVFSGCFLKALGIILESSWSLFRLCSTRNIWTLVRTFSPRAAGEALLYALYAVLVHEGSGCQTGHYYCFVKAKVHFVICVGVLCPSVASCLRVLF